MVRGRRYIAAETHYISRRTPGEIVDGFETVTYGPWEPVAPCATQPGASQENLDANREGAQIQYTVFGPPGVNASARDRWRIPGRGDYDVIGEGRELLNPYTGNAGCAILAGKYEG